MGNPCDEETLSLEAPGTLSQLDYMWMEVQLPFICSCIQTVEGTAPHYHSAPSLTHGIRSVRLFLSSSRSAM